MIIVLAVALTIGILVLRSSSGFRTFRNLLPYPRSSIWKSARRRSTKICAISNLNTALANSPTPITSKRN